MIKLGLFVRFHVIAFGSLAVLALSARGGEPVVASQSDKPPVEKKETPLLSFLDGKIVFDVEERTRSESRWNNRDFNSAVDDNNDDSWLLNRFRFGLAVKPVSWLKLYGQLQDSREAYSVRPNI